MQGDILRRQAALFEKIISTSEGALRLNPEYFRVGFYGRGFPQFLRVRKSGMHPCKLIFRSAD